MPSSPQSQAAEPEDEPSKQFLCLDLRESSGLPSSSTLSSSRYKTELCRSFTESGVCKYGGKCQFAHGLEELRDLTRHPKYKTEPCRTFHTVGFCPYGIRCHFVHNGEEEKKSSSSSSLSPQLRSSRPPLVKQSFSFAGFPSDPQQLLHPALPHPPPSSPSCTDITDLLSHAFLEMDSTFEVSHANQYQAAADQTPAVDPRTHFLPSPDSGYSMCGLSPTASPSLRRSPGMSAGPLGTRSLSRASLSDLDQDGSGGSSASSLSGSDSCGGVAEGNGRRLAVFSQLSVPEDGTGEQGQERTRAECLHAISMNSNKPDQKPIPSRSPDQRL